MGRAGGKIHIQFFDIHGGVGGALCAVQHHHSTHGMGALDDLLHGGTQAQHIGDHRHGDDLGLGGDLPVQFLGRQASVLAGIHIDELCAGGLGHALPRHHVGVMLCHRDNDLIALMQEMHAVAVGDQVQALGRVLGKDDLIVLGVEELRHGMARTLMGIGGTHRQLVNAAVGVCVLFIIVVDHRVQNLRGVLGGGGAVQIDKAFAVFIGSQNGKISRPIHR